MLTSGLHHNTLLVTSEHRSKHDLYFVIFKIGTHAMDSTLLKYSAKDHFFKAALCHFCVDMLNAKVSHNTEPVPMWCNCNTSHYSNIYPLVDQLAVQKYEEMFPAFSDSRECKLLKVNFAVVLDGKRWIIL